MNVQFLLLFSTTFFVLLNWWTGNTSVATINTTVAMIWFKNLFAIFTFVKILASIGWHSFFFLMPTIGTSYCRL